MIIAYTKTTIDNILDCRKYETVENARYWLRILAKAGDLKVGILLVDGMFLSAYKSMPNGAYKTTSKHKIIGATIKPIW